MSHPSPTSSDMTQAEEDAFIDSFIDYTGGMPETPTRDSPTTASTFEGDKPTPSEALDPLAVQILVMRLDTLRSLRGQENAPILDLMRAKINREAACSTLQSSLLDRLLTVGPAASEPVPCATTACADLTHVLSASSAETHTPRTFDPIQLVALSIPTLGNPPKRKLHTPAVKLTNGGRAICPADLDPTIPAPDLTHPVWVSCFTDIDGVSRNSTPISSPSSGARSLSGSLSPPSSPCSSPLSSPPSLPSSAGSMGIGGGHRIQAVRVYNGSPLSLSTRVNIPSSQ